MFATTPEFVLLAQSFPYCFCFSMRSKALNCQKSLKNSFQVPFLVAELLLIFYFSVSEISQNFGATSTMFLKWTMSMLIGIKSKSKYLHQTWSLRKSFRMFDTDCKWCRRAAIVSFCSCDFCLADVHKNRFLGPSLIDSWHYSNNVLQDCFCVIEAL